MTAEVERVGRHQLGHEDHPQVLDRIDPEHGGGGAAPVVVATAQRARRHLIDGRRETETEANDLARELPLTKYMSYKVSVLTFMNVLTARVPSFSVN